MKKLASACGILAIVSSSLAGNAPAVTAQSCNYYTGISVTGQKVNLDTCSISRTSDNGTNFIYYLGDKKLASKANCSDQTWTTSANTQVNKPQSQATKKMLDRVCNEQISSNSSTEEKTESTSEERSIAQASRPGYEDDLIRARGLNASFNQGGRLSANVLIENISGRTLLLANLQLGNGTVTVISDSGEAGNCDFQGLKYVVAEENKESAFSVLKSKGKATIAAINCTGISQSATKSVGVNIPLVVYGKEKNSQFTLTLTDIPVKKIPTR
ncbi:hypothetical protein [Chamaesiphon polymorphus]|nr:hypothetical protein [Chamaesiphon polymorphus]